MMYFARMVTVCVLAWAVLTSVLPLQAQVQASPDQQQSTRRFRRNRTEQPNGNFPNQANPNGQPGNGNNGNQRRRRRQQPKTPPVEFVPGGTISSAPVFGKNGLVYLASWNNCVYALDAQTGLLRWRFIAPKMLNASPVVGADGTVYACAYDSKLYALNGETGAEKWEFVTRSLLNTSPVVSASGDLVFVGGYDHALYAIDTQRGKQKWRNVLGAAVSSPIVGKDGTLYTAADKVFAFNPMTGAKKWEFQTGYDAPSAVTFGADGTIYAQSQDTTGRSYLCALDSRNGKQKWTFPLMQRMAYAPAVSGEDVFASADQVYSLRGLSGRLLWQFSEGSARWSSPVVQGSLVCVANGDSTLVALDRATGVIQWKFSTNDPLLSFPRFGPDGKVYIACEGDRKVYALNSRTGDIVWSFLQDPVPSPPPAPTQTAPANRRRRNG